MNPQIRILLLGGVLPVVAFTVIEEYFGTAWGIAAGMLFGIGEIIWEKRSEGKISPLTFGSNAFILVLGAISLWFQEGIWFKLQPAILELLFALILWISLWRGRSLLELMLEKQKQNVPAALLPYLRGICARLGIFFFLHALIATWAAIYWTTTAWALLKGVGLTVSLFLYFGAEMLYLRSRLKTAKANSEK